MVDGQERVWPRSAAVDVDPGVLDAVQAAADQAGLGVAEYLDAVSRAAAERAPDTVPEALRRARLARRAAAGSRSEAVALHAQAEQAVRRAGEVTRRSADVLALRGAGLGNIVYVRALWAAFEADGVAAMAELVSPDVRWWPVGASGRVLRGIGELSECAASAAKPPPITRGLQSRLPPVPSQPADQLNAE